MKTLTEQQEQAFKNGLLKHRNQKRKYHYILKDPEFSEILKDFSRKDLRLIATQKVLDHYEKYSGSEFQLLGQYVYADVDTFDHFEQEHARSLYIKQHIYSSQPEIQLVPAKRKRGRPPKVKPVERSIYAEPSSDMESLLGISSESDIESSRKMFSKSPFSQHTDEPLTTVPAIIVEHPHTQDPPEPVKKKIGRPRKSKPEEPLVPKTRGRPPKPKPFAAYSKFTQPSQGFDSLSDMSDVRSLGDYNSLEGSKSRIIRLSTEPPKEEPFPQLNNDATIHDIDPNSEPVESLPKSESTNISPNRSTILPQTTTAASSQDSFPSPTRSEDMPARLPLLTKLPSLSQQFEPVLPQEDPIYPQKIPKEKKQKKTQVQRLDSNTSDLKQLVEASNYALSKQLRKEQLMPDYSQLSHEQLVQKVIEFRQLADYYKFLWQFYKKQ